MVVVVSVLVFKLKVELRYQQAMLKEKLEEQQTMLLVIHTILLVVVELVPLDLQIQELVQVTEA